MSIISQLPFNKNYLSFHTSYMQIITILKHELEKLNFSICCGFFFSPLSSFNILTWADMKQLGVDPAGGCTSGKWRISWVPLLLVLTLLHTTTLRIPGPTLVAPRGQGSLRQLFQRNGYPAHSNFTHLMASMRPFLRPHWWSQPKRPFFILQNHATKVDYFRNN